MIEGGFVCFRWFGETTELAHELKGRSVDFVVRRRRLEVMQRFDVPAHGEFFRPRTRSSTAGQQQPPPSQHCDAAVVVLYATPFVSRGSRTAVRVQSNGAASASGM